MSGTSRSSRKSLLAIAGLVAVTVFVVGMLGGCAGGGTTAGTATTGGGAEKLKIALLLPETKTARYETPGQAAVREEGQGTRARC